MAIPPAVSVSLEISAGTAGFPEVRRRRAAKLAIPDPLAQWSVERSRFEVYRTDGIAFLESYAFTGLELVYCDPPYLISTRSKTSYGCGGSLRYKHEMADVDHRRLLRVLEVLPCRAILSGYDSPMYREALGKWIHTKFQAMTRKGLRDESLWSNFPPPTTELHDYRYLGSEFREREGIRRMVKTHVARLKRLPPLVRGAIVRAIGDIE
jgi:DNA adenine methylase